MKKITIYGIKNCDTMKKAFVWLDSNEIDYQFHDYKKLGIDEKSIRTWAKTLELDLLINKKGTTFKALTAKEQKACDKLDIAIPILIEKPSLIKRPVIAVGKKFYVGFNPENWESIFNHGKK